MYMPITGACFLIAGIGCLLMAVVEFLSWCCVSGMPRIPAWAPWGAYFFCGAAMIEDGLCKMGKGRP